MTIVTFTLRIYSDKKINCIKLVRTAFRDAGKDFGLVDSKHFVETAMMREVEVKMPIAVYGAMLARFEEADYRDGWLNRNDTFYITARSFGERQTGTFDLTNVPNTKEFVQAV